ncbi:protein mono-ADP-ribosyltransferase PARP10-like [Thrips palmi]|uniref:Poly [ADP-ribose] polymerase n=1 Tax=Thrips palmi TaxID=161013 RepID=A0A6P9AB18_THRPL|nr:protein mono-ADP-ribosyltransferase PARP10-like [Thrips palmi]
MARRTPLEPGTDEHQEVSRLFNARNRSRGVSLNLVSVEKVRNDALEQRFRAKEREYREQSARTGYGHVRIVDLWHGTRQEHVESILENNYDVARHGQGVGHRFGAGVSFSALSGYASHYCDDHPIDYMLLNKVLISNIVEVQENFGGSPVLLEPPIIPGSSPPIRYDTTAKNAQRMDVIVKFDNDTFLPTHVVRFTRVHGAYYSDDSE